MQMLSSSHLDHPRYLDENSCDHKKIETFQQYMSRVGNPIVDLYEVPSKNARNKLKYTFIPNVHRSCIKTIIDFVCGLHKQEGKSLKDFQESNIVFHRGELKFRGLVFVPRLKEKNRAKDFKLLHNVIEDLICKYNFHNYQIPNPLRILLFILNDYRDFEAAHGVRIEDTLPNHLGILSHDTVLDYMRNFHEKSSFMRDHGEEGSYNSATKEMYRRDKNWTLRFTGSNPDAQAGPVLDIFNFENKGKKKTYSGGMNRHILKFCRHNAAHLHEHIKKYSASSFSSKDIELIIMAFFDKELLSFQRLTYKYKIHRHFIPDYTSMSSSTGWGEHGYRSKRAKQGCLSCILM